MPPPPSTRRSMYRACRAPSPLIAAPATALLLEGFEMIDDGIDGERVTPTGAAILRALPCISRRGITGRMERTGTGFGTRTLPGMSNVLRVLVFATSESKREPNGIHREL